MGEETGAVEMATGEVRATDGGADPNASGGSNGSDEDGSTEGGSDEDGSDEGDASTGEPEAAPMILSLSVEPPSITVGGTVTVAALVTHPAGKQAIVGGTLESADGQTYGQFAYAEGGGFEVAVAWDTLAEVDAFTFAGEGSLVLTVSFFDASGAMTADTVDVGLYCDGGESRPAVCGDGTCVDLENHAEQCGQCGTSCEVQAAGTQFEAGGCGGGQCLPMWQDACIVQSDPWSTCTEYCAAQGLTCSATCGAEGARARFLSADHCEGFGVGAFSDLCDLAFDFNGGDDAYRCCCG